MGSIMTLVFWIAFSLITVVFGGILISTESYYFGGFLAVLGIWLLSWIQIVGPDEMAILVVLGEPTGFRESGFTVVPRFIAELARYPKTLFNLGYPNRKVITKADEYGGKDYGSQVVTISAVAYLRFPRGDGLKEILRSQVPTDEEALKAWTKEAVDGALRVVLGKMTWKEATEEIKKVTTNAEEIFTQADGALLRAGFIPDDIQLTIEEIRLPPELEKVLPGVDRQRLEAEAAPFEAKQVAGETIGSVVEMMAVSRGKTVEEMKVLIDGDKDLQRELLDLSKDLITRRMAIDGKSFVDIRVEGAGGFEKLVLSALAAWQRMPKGGGAGEEDKSPKKKKKKQTVRVQRGGEWYEVEKEKGGKEKEEEEESGEEEEGEEESSTSPS